MYPMTRFASLWGYRDNLDGTHNKYEEETMRKNLIPFQCYTDLFCRYGTQKGRLYKSDLEIVDRIKGMMTTRPESRAQYLRLLVDFFKNNVDFLSDCEDYLDTSGGGDSVDIIGCRWLTRTEQVLSSEYHGADTVGDGVWCYLIDTYSVRTADEILALV
jgi:hypothetical protein